MEATPSSLNHSEALQNYSRHCERAKHDAAIHISTRSGGGMDCRVALRSPRNDGHRARHREARERRGDPGLAESTERSMVASA